VVVVRFKWREGMRMKVEIKVAPSAQQIYAVIIKPNGKVEYIFAPPFGKPAQ
jgi:hypothetical protein